MKKQYIIGSMAVVIVLSGSIAYAAPMTKKDRADMRDEQKTERATAIADKKVNIKNERKAKKNAIICERIDKTMARFEERQKARVQKGIDNVESGLHKMESRRQNNRQRLQERRNSRDVQRQVFYTKLEAQVQTEEQVAAVAKFKKIVEEAVQVRRTAIDATTRETQLANDALIAGKKAKIVKLYNEYEADRVKTMSQTRAKCDDTTTSEDLKGFAKAANTQLKQLRTEFRAQLSQTRQTSTGVKNLVKGRNEVIKGVVATFKTTVDAAREELKLAFNESVVVSTEPTVQKFDVK